MTHFTPEEFVDAIESTLPASRTAHLDACEACRREVDAMRTVIGAARSADAGVEPSPLFWPHFAARVRQATAAAEAVSGHRGGAIAWLGPLRFAAAAAAVIVVTALAIWITRLPPVSLPSPATGVADVIDPLGPLPVPDDPVPAPATPEPMPAPDDVAVVAGGADEDEQWRRVVTLSDKLPSEATLGVVPSAGGAAMLIEDLSQDQLREFLRLLRAEQGGMR